MTSNTTKQISKYLNIPQRYIRNFENTKYLPTYTYKKLIIYFTYLWRLISSQIYHKIAIKNNYVYNLF